MWEFEGRVVRVSADAVRHAETGLSWYEVELVMGTPLVSGVADDSRAMASGAPGA